MTPLRTPISGAGVCKVPSRRKKTLAIAAEITTLSMFTNQRFVKSIFPCKRQRSLHSASSSRFSTHQAQAQRAPCDTRRAPREISSAAGNPIGSKKTKMR